MHNMPPRMAICLRLSKKVARRRVGGNADKSGGPRLHLATIVVLTFSDDINVAIGVRPGAYGSRGRADWPQNEPRGDASRWWDRVLLPVQPSPSVSIPQHSLTRCGHVAHGSARSRRSRSKR